MPRYRVRLIKTEEHVVTIDVAEESWNAMRLAAIEAARLDAATGDVRIEDAVQIEGPWLRDAYWYDLHGPGDVFLAAAPMGHRLRPEHDRLIRVRLAMLGLDVVDAWNGVGCPNGSYKCVGRRGTAPLTASEHALIMAPPASVPEAAARWSAAAVRYYLAVETSYAAAGLDAETQARADVYLDGIWSALDAREQREIEIAFLRATPLEAQAS